MPTSSRRGAGEVLLCDSAASVRASIAARFADNPKIKVIAPEDVERLPRCDRSISSSPIRSCNT